MKKYDLIVQRKQDIDVPVGDFRHEYEAVVRNLKEIDLAVEGLKNKISMSIHHVIHLVERISKIDVMGERNTTVLHPLRITISDIEVNVKKRISANENQMRLTSYVSAYIGMDTSVEENKLRLNCIVAAETMRLRLLSELDNLMLEDIDDMTLEELDYLKG